MELERVSVEGSQIIQDVIQCDHLTYQKPGAIWRNKDPIKFYSLPPALLASLLCEFPRVFGGFSPNLVNFTDSNLMKSGKFPSLPGWWKHCYWERER